MSKEYRTLDQWFKDKDRGDGRKFTKEAYLGKSNYFFEPIFRGSNGVWHGVNNLKEHACHAGDEQCLTTFSPWVEWNPPKTKKNVTLYRAVFKMLNGEYVTDTSWSSTKTYTCTLIHLDSKPPIFYEEREIEVDE